MITKKAGVWVKIDIKVYKAMVESFFKQLKSVEEALNGIRVQPKSSKN